MISARNMFRSIINNNLIQIILKATPNEYSRPESSKNWGMCSGHCNQRSRVSETLKEAQLDILTPKECKLLGKSQGVDPNVELCAGKKRFFPTVSLYRMMYSRNRKIQRFKLKVRIKILKINHFSLIKLAFRQWTSFV